MFSFRPSHMSRTLNKKPKESVNVLPLRVRSTDNIPQQFHLRTKYLISYGEQIGALINMPSH